MTTSWYYLSLRADAQRAHAAGLLSPSERWAFGEYFADASEQAIMGMSDERYNLLFELAQKLHGCSYDSARKAAETRICCSCGGRVLFSEFGPASARYVCQVCGTRGGSRRLPRKRRGARPAPNQDSTPYLRLLSYRRKWWYFDTVSTSSRVSFSWGARGYAYCDERGNWTARISRAGMRPHGKWEGVIVDGPWEPDEDDLRYLVPVRGLEGIHA